MEYRRFYLVPGQQAPEGSTSIGMPDGGIVWIGEKWTADKIESHIMSAAELEEYNLFLKYQEEIILGAHEISFNDFKDPTKLAARKLEIKCDIDSVSATLTAQG